MNARRKCVLYAGAVMGLSVIVGNAAMAHENSIAFPYEQESAWDEIALTNDDTVSTGVNIRSAAAENSTVIGCLYQGGAVWILEKGDEWTEVYSGGLTGFVKNEYLLFGQDARELGQAHGVEGVKTTWDDVKLYSGADGNTEVLADLSYGESFILTQDEGHWLQVQRGADSIAYVSEEDVSRVLLFDTAVPTDEAYLEPEVSYDTYSDDTYYEPVYSDTTYADEAYTDAGYTADVWYADESYNDSYTEDTYSDSAYTDNSYTDVTYTEESYTDTTYTDDIYTGTTYTEDTYTDAEYTEDSYTDTEYTEDTYTDTTYTEDTTSSATTDESYYDAETGIYYDASTGLYYDSGTGILYDAYWNPVNADIAAPPTYSEDTYVEDTYTEDTYVEDTYTEDDHTEDTSAAPSTSSDDASLLAALIYCEAGNQSYDGMVAVGAVVMNRVSSPLFPNSISEVIYQSGQFTPASSGWLSSALASGVPSTCYNAAIAAMNGENPIESALYFNTGSGKGIKLGDHQFY